MPIFEGVRSSISYSTPFSTSCVDDEIIIILPIPYVRTARSREALPLSHVTTPITSIDLGERVFILTMEHNSTVGSLRKVCPHCSTVVHARRAVERSTCKKIYAEGLHFSAFIIIVFIMHYAYQTVIHVANPIV